MMELVFFTTLVCPDMGHAWICLSTFWHLETCSPLFTWRTCRRQSVL